MHSLPHHFPDIHEMG